MFWLIGNRVMNYTKRFAKEYVKCLQGGHFINTFARLVQLNKLIEPILTI